MRKSKYPEHDSYPFSTKEIENVVTKKRSKEVVNENSGEVMVLTDMSKGGVVMIDKGNYIKMFPEGMLLIERIGKRGATLLFWILKDLKVHANEVLIDPKAAIEQNKNLRGDGFYVGLRELLDYGFLAGRKGKKNIFYINGNMFFNGDRRRKIKKK